MSTPPRLFVPSPLAQGASAPIGAEQANYLFRVLRLGRGDMVRVFNGRDGEWSAAISETGKSSGALTPQSRLREQSAVADLELLFAPLKKTCTDFVVEKATELGASRIRPVLTERTQTRTVRIDRLEKIALEAAEQTERLDLPEVREAAPLMSILSDWDESRALIFCDEAGDDAQAPWGGDAGRARPMLDVVSALPDGPAAILIGPEGGFSPAERQRLRALPFACRVLPPGAAAYESMHRA